MISQNFTKNEVFPTLKDHKMAKTHFHQNNFFLCVTSIIISPEKFLDLYQF